MRTHSTSLGRTTSLHCTPPCPLLHHQKLYARAHARVRAIASGQNQESSSEAVNAYYALYLFGLATGNAPLADWGRLMLALELHSTQTYFQITSNSPIYL